MAPRLFDIEFVVSVAPIIPCRRPVIGLDGPVQGADLCFDHHMTGEPVNLLAPLTLAIVSGLRRGVLPSDRAYLERLGAMAADARRVITQMDGRVTVLVPSTYIDPFAIYRVVTTDLIVLMRPARDGGVHYSLGVHPRAYGRIALGRTFHALTEQEPGWGGRGNAGGSPLGAGSRIPLRDLLGLLNSHP